MNTCLNCRYARKPVLKKDYVGCTRAYIDDDHETKLIMAKVVFDSKYVYDRSPKDEGKGLMFVCPVVNENSSCYLFEEEKYNV